MRHGFDTHETINDVTRLTDRVLTELNKKKWGSWVDCDTHSPSTIVDTLIASTATFGSFALSIAGFLVFLGTSLNEDDLPDGAGRWPFAIAAGLCNMAQIKVASAEALERQLSYLKTLGTALIDGRAGIRRLLRDKKKALSFLLREAMKLTFVYYASLMAPSLSLQVSWLHSDFFMHYIRAAIMAMLEPATEEIFPHRFLPTLTSAQIIEEEREKFLDLFITLLEENARHAARHINFPAARAMLQAIQNQNSHALSHQVLDPARPIKSKRSSSPSVYLQVVITGSFTTMYFLSNTGSYVQTWQNPDADQIAKLSTIFGDTMFGLFMSMRASKIIAEASSNIRLILNTEKSKVLLTILSMSVASLTIGSTWSPNQKAGMPLEVQLPGFGGTLIDNAFFGACGAIELERAITVRKKSDTPHHRKALIETFYQLLIKEYQQMATKKAIEYIAAIEQTDSDFFRGYENRIRAALPWAKNLPIDKVLNALCTESEPAAMHIINRSGRFGPGRRCIELSGISVAILIAGLGLIPFNLSTAAIIFEYTPIAAVPSAAGMVGLFSHCCLHPIEADEKYDLISSESNKNDDDETDKESTLAYLGKMAAFMAIPWLMKYSSLPISWIMMSIFDMSAEDAELYSKNLAVCFGAVTAGVLTQHVVVNSR
jgi:hypothetical protein